jgi:hypothetical protein
MAQHCSQLQQEPALYLNKMALTLELSHQRDETFHAGVSFVTQGWEAITRWLVR